MTMDWTAVGAIATVGLIIVGYLQFRAVRLSDKNRVSSAQSAPAIPTINYSMDTGSGSYTPALAWKPDFRKDDYNQLSCIKRDIEQFSFCIVTIKNDNLFVVNRICADLDGGLVWSAKIESTKHLSEYAVRLDIKEKGLRITIDEMPAGDVIKVSAVGRYFSPYMSSANASIKLRSGMDYDA